MHVEHHRIQLVLGDSNPCTPSYVRFWKSCALGMGVRRGRASECHARACPVRPRWNDRVWVGGWGGHILVRVDVDSIDSSWVSWYMATTSSGASQLFKL